MKYIYGAIIGGALVYGFLFTFEGIKGDFPAEYLDKFVATKSCPKCDECKPYVKIEDSKVYCDSSPYLSTIRELNNKIFELKVSNECFKAKCIAFAEPNCN